MNEMPYNLNKVTVQIIKGSLAKEDQIPEFTDKH